MHDMVIRNGKLVTPTGIIEGDLTIDDGKISGIILNSSSEKTKANIDAEQNYVLPGLIDPHVHLMVSTEDFIKNCKIETRGAAIGGITTLFHVLWHNESYLKFANRLIDVVNQDSLVNIAFHAVMTDEEQINEIPRYVEELGIKSFKFFMTHKNQKPGYMPSYLFPKDRMDDGLLLKGFEKVANVENGVAFVHAENIEIIARAQREIEKTGRQDTAAWSDSRPRLAERESLLRALFFAGETKTPIYIAHLSTGEGVDIIAQSKKGNHYVFVETCGHYLVFTKDSKFQKSAFGKVNPPLREKTDGEKLWKGLGAGVIDCIGSDHCPFKIADKGDDIWRAKAGLPGIAATLPILLTEGVNKGRITIEQIANIFSFNAAKIFGLLPRKGIIAVGSDADLIIADLKKEVKLSYKLFETTSDYSPYEGYLSTGFPILTIVGGEIVYQDGKIVGRGKRASYLKR